VFSLSLLYFNIDKKFVVPILLPFPLIYITVFPREKRRHHHHKNYQSLN
jgi:hypothetical protein